MQSIFVPRAFLRPARLGVCVFLCFAAGAAAQESAAGKGETAEPAKDAPAAAEGAVPEALPSVSTEPTLWAEPRRRELLRNEFKEYAGPSLSEPERAALFNSVLQMARGGALDRAAIKRHVDTNAVELTKRSNIAAMMGTEGAGRNTRALDEAANRLIQPLLEAPTAANTAFRGVYVANLLAAAPTLLQGHLLTRTLFMVVLSRAGSPEVIPELIKQLSDPSQTHSVKLLAAVGLTAAGQRGRRLLDPNAQSIPAARAIASFLQEEKDLPWPVQVRALEALGSMRQSTANPLGARPEIAAVAFELLADPEVDPIARVWAGWAISRMDFPQQAGEPNIELVAYELGEAAAAVGEKVVEVPFAKETPARNLKLVARWSEPLLRILDAFVGDPEVSRSGLNRQAARAIALRGIEQRIRALASACLAYSQSVGGQVEAARADVVAALDELKRYLAQNPPKEAQFFPGGPEVALPDPAPGAAAKKAESAATKRAESGQR
jgi:hypothetical protein